MVVIAWIPRATVALLAVLLSGCITTRSSPVAEEGAEQRLAQWSAGHAVEDGVQRQIAGPGAEARARGAATDTVPPPGEPLGIQAGKSRILHFSRPVQRVSIGDPEVAGVVVLGPRTIMVNGKVLPKPQGGQEASAQELRLATISNRPFTAEPRIAETTLAVWEAGAAGPVIHPITVA